MSVDEIRAKLQAAVHRIFPAKTPWMVKGDIDDAVAAIDDLVALAQNPAGALRLFQASKVSASDPAAGDRPSVACIVQALSPRMPLLAAGPDRVGIVRMMADVALEIEPSPIELRLGGYGAKRTAWPSMKGLTPIKKKTTSTDARSDVDYALEALDGTRKLHHQVLSKLMLMREVNALWWSKAMYSLSLDTDYRDLVLDDCIPPIDVMATDILSVMGHEPDPALTALFVETVRVIVPDIDERRPWSVWIERLLDRASSGLPRAFENEARADATALPTSAWLLGVDDPLRQPTAESLVLGREIVRLYFRERQVADWFADMVEEVNA